MSKAEPMDSPSTTAPPAPAFPEQASRSDVDEILRRKRKAREYKACYPCRQRKVKCDQAVPCKTCIAREHPELCTYHPPAESHPPAKRISHGPNHYGLADSSNGLNSSINYNVNGTVTIGREDWERLCSKLNAVERSLLDLKGTIRHASEGPAGPSNGHTETAASTPSRQLSADPSTRHVSSQGIHTTNSITGQTVHLGGNSVPALVMSLGKGEAGSSGGVQELLGKNVLPIFGLDNESATYPFVDLWGLPHGSMSRVYELCNALPNDSDCWNLLKYHKETAHVVYPAVADIEKLESELLRFLITRGGSRTNEEDGSVTGVTEQSIFGKDLHWVGLLFAVLASGCQCSALPRKERELTSQVYVCCSFECLRFTNFLSHSSLESIQSLLILGNVMSNNMNAGVSWSLLGLTIRLAQSLGLHRACPTSSTEETKLTRKKVWWAVLWQDSLLSITYDRASSTSTTEPVPINPESSPGNRPYIECMYRLCKVGLDIVSERASNQDPDLRRIAERRQEIQDIMFDAADFLRDSRKCRSMRDQLQHWALYLHMSYIMSELCRPAISPTMENNELTRSMRKACVDSLANTVEAFLGLQNMTVFASRSWAAVHRSLSCALLLGILKEPERNDRARMLLEKLITVLTDITRQVDPAELSQPITRSIIALRKLLNLQESKATSLGPQQAMPSTATSTPTMVGYTLEDINGALMGDDGSFPLNHNSPLVADLDSEASPYALMDSIIWGVKRTPPG